MLVPRSADGQVSLSLRGEGACSPPSSASGPEDLVKMQTV